MTIADLIFTQATLKTVRDTLASRPETSLFGLLVGEIHRDPIGERPWVRVNRVMHGPAISGDPSAASLAEIMNGLMKGLDDSQSPVGWYRSHPDAGLYLSSEEALFHESCFADPWGSAMVFMGDSARLTGSVFQRTDPEGLSRSVYTPFYELVDDSSQFNGTTKRTYIAWPNYQPETRVVQAGQGGVSSQIPGESRVLIDVPTPPAAAEPPKEDAQRAVEIPQALEPQPAVELQPALERQPAVQLEPAVELGSPVVPESVTDRGEDTDVEWEKKQIQRSLTAVGRSIGSSTLGGLDTPVIVALEPPAAETDASSKGVEAEDDEDGDSRATHEAAAHESEVEAEPQTVIPIRLEVPVGAGSEAGLVGRARRRSGPPISGIASAAAGLILLIAAGWFGSGMIRGQAAPVTEEAGASSGSSVAGLSLGPTELFMTRPGTDPADTITGEPASEEIDSSFASIGPLAGFDTTDTAVNAEAEDSAAILILGQVAEEQPVVTLPPPPEPEIVDAPLLGVIALDAPEVSAFKNALDIFYKEAQRYELLRIAFDNGEGSCNPLNLAVRGVRGSFDRLDSRFQVAAEGLAGPELRTFDGARRQNAMIDTHYSLTDCPASPGSRR